MSLWFKNYDFLSFKIINSFYLIRECFSEESMLNFYTINKAFTTYFH